MVESCQLTVRGVVGGGLRFHDGGEFVRGVIHAHSMGKVNESAGGEAVTTR